MSVGTISSFPISTCFEYATSGRFGICPQLKATIDQLDLANKNLPVSEQAVREAIDAINTQITFENLGISETSACMCTHAYGIYESTSGNTGLFKSLVILNTENLTGFLTDNNTIVLSGCSEETSGSTTSADIVVQGGKYQYCSTIPASSITIDGLILAYAKQDDLIGKIFIKCLSGFDNNNSTYSIGYTDNKEKYVQQFIAPSAYGLVDFTYGLGLSGEYDWIDTDKNIKIFRHGDQSTNGILGISIFYDQVYWRPQYGYIFVDPIHRFNLDFDYLSIQSRVSRLVSNIDQFAAAAFNDYIYLGGGRSTICHDNINRYDTKNDTVLPLDRGDLSIARRALSSCKSSTKIYFIGGTDITTEASYNRIDYIFVNNDTMNAVINATLPASRSSHGSVFNNISVWVAGGYSSGTSIVNSITKMNFATDGSTANIGATLHTASLKMDGEFITNTTGYYLPGHNSTNASINIMDKLNLSVETITSDSVPFNITRILGNACQSNLFGYRLGGVSEYSQITIYLIEKYNFSTSVSSIIETSMDSSIYSHRCVSI